MSSNPPSHEPDVPNPDLVKSIINTIETLAKGDSSSTTTALLQYLVSNGYSISKPRGPRDQELEKLRSRRIAPIIMSWADHGLSSSDPDADLNTELKKLEKFFIVHMRLEEPFRITIPERGAEAWVCDKLLDEIKYQ